ncbi:hypothetical protein AeMF1_011314 [Aphanomyces euteiches]|nr:hypothetical protein AeMF1_011314 [Aphanomyces euteiches]KAH9181014.1 hypothetical protein AeNC1_017010 [Aphanomyces euteiches]
MPATRLPLPLEFLPPSVDTAAQWRRLAMQTKDQLVRLARLRGGSVGWTPQFHDKQVQVFRGTTDESAPAGVQTWCAVMDVQATIEEVDVLFRGDGPSNILDTCRIFDSDVLDATSVCTLEDTIESSMGVDWILTRSPGVLMRPRDWCLLTYNVNSTVQGRRGWVRAYTSVETENCPEDQGRIVRGQHLRSGYVVMESSRPGVLHVRLFMQCSLGGNMSEAAVAKTLLAKGQHLRHMDLCLRQSRLSIGAVVNMYILESHVRCQQCSKSFSLFHPKVGCQKCSLVFCRTCCPQWQVQVLGVPTKLRACLPCSLVTSTKSRLSFDEHASRQTEMVEQPEDDVDVWINEDEASQAHEAMFNEIKQRVSVLIPAFPDRYRVSKEDAWPKQQVLERRRSSMMYGSMQSRPPNETREISFSSRGESPRGRRESSMGRKDSSMSRKESSLHRKPSTDGGDYFIRQSRGTPLEDDDIAKQIYQNRQSVMQII